MIRVASIDIGTVSVRLAVADVENGKVLRCAKQSRICDLGEGLASSGKLSQAACERVVATVDDYLSAAKGAGAHGHAVRSPALLAMHPTPMI